MQRKTLVLVAAVAAAGGLAFALVALSPDSSNPAPAEAQLPPATSAAAEASLAAAPLAEAQTATAVQAPPQPANETRAEVTRIYEQLRGGPTTAACRGVQYGLLDLVENTAEDDPLWNWAMDRARDCLRAPGSFRLKNDLMAGLLRSKPNHPRVRELEGLQHYDTGNLEEAVFNLELALENGGGGFEAWQTLADAQLALARGKDDALARLSRAEAAAYEALKYPDSNTRPFALHTMARVQLELGRPAEAIQWAERAMQALQEGGPRYQSFMAAELHVFVGQIYYRAGQPDTGRAYMDQGVAIAQPGTQQNDLRRIRDEFLKNNS